MRQHLIVPSICGSDIGLLEWPDIRSLEHLLELLDFINDAFNVHPQQYSEPAMARHSALLDSRGGCPHISLPEWTSVAGRLPSEA